MDTSVVVVQFYAHDQSVYTSSASCLTQALCVRVSETTTCLCICVLQCMFVIWLGAFVSLSLATFSGYSSQLTSAGSATGMLASIATRSLPWSLDAGDDVDVGWRLFTALFCISAVASMSAYVSPLHCYNCCLLQSAIYQVDHKNWTISIYQPARYFFWSMTVVLNYVTVKYSLH